jgi:hypothetical protein
MSVRLCQICGNPADLANGNQAFCDACWATTIAYSWLPCLICGQMFWVYRALNGHMNKHRHANQAGLEHSIPPLFTRLTGR